MVSAVVDDAKRSIRALLARHDHLTILIVDVQHDFSVQNYGGTDRARLYVAGGESVVVTNIEVVRALRELCEEREDIARRLSLILTMDMHRDYPQISSVAALHAFIANPDPASASVYGAEINYLKSVHGEEKALRILQGQYQELQPMEPGKGRFGHHCMVGHLGCQLATDFYDALKNLLAAYSAITASLVVKMLFDGIEGGVVLTSNAGGDFGNVFALDLTQRLGTQEYANKSFFTDAVTPSADFKPDMPTLLKKLAPGAILATGICGNICVEQTINSILHLYIENAQALDVIVLASATKFLVTTKGNISDQIEETRTNLQHTCQQIAHVSVVFTNP